MKLGEETWKWALVVLLLAVFLLVANQAYRTVNNPEDQFPPPDDYTKGDSFDIERNPGPGAGQPIDVPTPTTPGTTTGTAQGTTAPVEPTQPIERPVVDWSQMNSGAQATSTSPQPEASPAPVPDATPAPVAPPVPAPAAPTPDATPSPAPSAPPAGSATGN